MKKTLLVVTFVCGIMLGNMALAEPFGYSGFSLGSSDAQKPNDGDKSTKGFGTISGAIGTTIGANGTIILEGEARKGGHNGSIVENKSMQRQFQIGAHYLHDFDGNKFGAFLAYGDSNNDSNGGSGEDYEATFFGLEAIFAASDSTDIYGQFGVGDGDDNEHESSSGFEDGKFARLGLAFSGLDDTVLKLEGEIAKTDEYEDDDEPGRMRMISLSGETTIGGGENLALTYGISRGRYEAEGDTDIVYETQVSFGIRYYFGGATSKSAIKSGLIGLPSLPTRAMSWTAALD